MPRLRPALGFVIAAVGLAGAPGAWGASFYVVKSAPDMVTLVDPDAVEVVGDAGMKRAWSVSIQKSLVSGGPQQPGYVRTQNEYDCREWKARWRTFSVYSRFGELVLHKDNDDPAWTPMDGNFEATASARIICDGRGASSVYTAASIGQLVVSVMQAWDAAAPMPPLQPVTPIARSPKPSGSKPRDKTAQRR